MEPTTYARAVAERQPVSHLFHLVITTIEEFAAFLELVRGHEVQPAALADFATATVERHAERAAPSTFMLVVDSLEDFAAFIIIIRGDRPIDSTLLAETRDALAVARTKLTAAMDARRGTPASPAAGPPSPYVSRSPSVIEGASTMAPAGDTENPVVESIVAEATNAVTVMGGAAAMISGFDAELAAGIQAALDGGATPGQLARLTSFSGQVKTQADVLAAAIAARTVADGEVTPALASKLRKR